MASLVIWGLLWKNTLVCHLLHSFDQNLSHNFPNFQGLFCPKKPGIHSVICTGLTCSNSQVHESYTISGLDKSHVRYSDSTCSFSRRASRFQQPIAWRASLTEIFHGLFHCWMHFGLIQNRSRQRKLKCKLPKGLARIVIFVKPWYCNQCSSKWSNFEPWIWYSTVHKSLKVVPVWRGWEMRCWPLLGVQKRKTNYMIDWFFFCHSCL